jgi:hypothetical protein
MVQAHFYYDAAVTLKEALKVQALRFLVHLGQKLGWNTTLTAWHAGFR